MSEFLSPTQIVRFDDDLKPAFAPAQFGVFEWQDLFFQWPGAQKLRINDQTIASVAPGVFRVRFENRIGLAKIQPFFEEKPLDAPLWVEVLSPKISNPRAHLAWWRAILGQLFDLSPRLLWNFDGDNQTRRNFAFPDAQIGVLEALDWLEKRQSSVELLLRATLATHAIKPQKFEARPNQIRRLESENWREIARNRGQNEARFTQFQLAPLENSPEREFASAFLARVEKSLGNEIWPAEIGEKLEKARQFTRASRGILSGENSVQMQKTPQKPISSAVGRAWMELESSFGGAGNPLWAACENAAKLRDVASLWEFWAFFALVEHLENALEQSAILHAPIGEKRGLLPSARAVFERGELQYNVAPLSYSTPLRPDFLWRENGVAQLAFDAKFRSQIEENAFNGGDLHKMHAYRDALGVRAAIALHPGARSVFFDRKRGQIENWNLRDVLAGALEGVGIWGIRPLL